MARALSRNGQQRRGREVPLALLVLSLAVVALSGCTKVLGDFKLGSATGPVDAGNDVRTRDIVVTPTEKLQTTEWGDRASFTIVLKTAPRSNVSISLSSSAPNEGTVSPEGVTFTPTNWNAPQTVWVTGVEDDAADGNVIYNIITSPASSDDLHFKDMDPPDVSVLNVDDDTPGTIVTPLVGLTTTEFGASATFTVILTAPPQEIVTIDLSSEQISEAKVSPATLAFSPANYRSPQTVTVTGVDDNDIDGPAAFHIITSPTKSRDPGYDGLPVPDVDVVNLDDESPGVTISPLEKLVTSESGLTAAITVVLNTAPTADVSIGFSTSLPKEATVSPAKLTFTAANWRAPQTVTVTGQNDDELDGNQLYMVAIAPLESTDDRYRGIDPPDLEAVNVDNDSPGLIVSPQRGLVTSEDGQSATFTIALASKPMGEVTLDLSSTAPTEGSINPKRITFTPLNWNARQTITVTGVDDGNIDGNAAYDVRGKVDVMSSDPDYATLAEIDVELVNLDNDTPGVNITPIGGLTTSESGAKATFNVALRSKPTSPVTINLSTNRSTEGTVFPSSLVFTPANFAAPQKVTVSGVDDMVRDGNQPFIVITEPAVSMDDGYKNLDAPNVDVVNVDDDTPSVLVTKSGDLTTTEAGGTAIFTVQLGAAPKNDVAVGLSSSNGSEGDVNPGVVTFTAANWSSPQTVVVTGKDDSIADGPQPYRVVIAPTSSSDLDYQGIDTDDVPVTNLDDETPAVVVSAASPLMTTESGGSATFTVALGSQPNRNVTLLLSSSRPSEGAVSPVQLTFTSSNWKSPQVVTVTGADDLIADGNQPYAILLSSTASTDSGYNNLKPADVPVLNVDDETPGVNVVAPRALATSENGTSVQFTVSLTSAPKSDVTIALRSTLVTEGVVSPQRLVFTATDWSAPQRVTVTGVDDGAVDGARPYKIILDPPTGDPAYASVDPSDVDLVNLDNDAPGIWVIAPKIATTSESGASTAFGVVLMSRPADLVTVPLVRSNPSECTLSRNSLKFTPSNWDTPQWVTVTGADDMVPVADGDTPYRIAVGPSTSASAPYQGKRGADVQLVNLDNDVAGLVVSLPQGYTTEGGIATNFTVALATSPTYPVNVPIGSARPSEGTPLVTSLIFTPDNWNAPQTVTVRGIDDRVADGDQVYRVVVGPSASGDANNPAGDPAYKGKRAPDVVITNLDDDGPAIRVIAAPDLRTTEAGGTAKFTVSLATAPTANVSVPLVSRDTNEGAVTDPSSGTLVFTPTNWSIAQTVTVTGVGDAEPDGNVPYSIRFQPATSPDARYADRAADDVMLTNIDDDSPGITISGAQNLTTTEGGGTATFRVVLNMAPTAGVSFFVHSSNPAEGTVSPEQLLFTVDDWNIPHTVTITGQQDTKVDGNQVYSIIIDPAESSDMGYAGLVVDPLTVTNLDDDSPKQRSSSARPSRDSNAHATK